jgi:hypothetical protein
MDDLDKLARAAHDVGLAGWFGGALMGASAINGTAKKEGQTGTSVRIANEAWRRWSPFWAASVTLYGLGSTRLTKANASRIRRQSHVRELAALKAGLSLAALGASGYARMLARGLPEDSAPTAEQAQARKRLARTQWAVPGLLAGAVAVNALMGEQQRPLHMAKGIVRNLRS